jgi:hypothetical protein
MNAPLTDDLLQQLRADGLPRIASQLGVAPAQVDEAAAAALPLLLGAMGRNARDPRGADALYGALAHDHRGLDPGNVLGTVLGGGMDGTGILRHVLGRREPLAAQTLGAIGGLGQDRASMLLRMLAPVVMAYLARRVFTPADAAGRETPAPTPQGLAGALDREEREMRSREGFGGGLLSMLDRDDDGDVDLQDFVRGGGAAPLDVQTAEMRSPRPLL